ncbi:hypothetical protein GCM10022214_21990 [Actinomadura miaoliensis]|uniref:Uncharacterized protein n=1 Tax=Actinomadura miaoliensis TaxID=430685 RepID=A0ABP7VH12_9ACTN
MPAPAITQDTTAAGPAPRAAYSDPNSQPEPMIEPREKNISGISPTSRLSPPPFADAGRRAIFPPGDLRGRTLSRTVLTVRGGR